MKITKTYCDICEKELDNVFSLVEVKEFTQSTSPIQLPKIIIMKDICDTCAASILTIITELKKSK